MLALLFALAGSAIAAESRASTTTSTQRDFCDAADNDGDGVANEGWAAVLGTDAGEDGQWVCATEGMAAGEGITNSSIPIPPPDDAVIDWCNNLDDDGDGAVDEPWSPLLAHPISLSGPTTPFGGVWICSADGMALEASTWRDETHPTVDLGAPVDGSTHPLGSVVVADYSCDKPVESGGEMTTAPLATCVGDVSDGSPIDTSVAGVHSFTVTAEDAVGNRTQETVTYTVAAPSGGTAPQAPLPGGTGPPPTGPQPPGLRAKALKKCAKIKNKAKKKRCKKRAHRQPV